MKSTRSMGFVCASIMVAGATFLPMIGEAKAQTFFTTIQAFGDSYADTGNLFKILHVPNPVQYPTGRFSGGTNFVDTTSSLLGIPQTNFAIGGAKTGTTNTVAPGIPGFTQEWQGFVGSGMKIAPSDLVEISIGGNDARAYYQGGGTLAGVPAAATVSAAQALAGLNALVGVGARTIVFTTGDVGQLPEAAANPNAFIGSAYSQNYNAQMQVALAAIARSGVRVELVDVSLLGSLIKANPGLYGLSSAGACPLACIGNPALQNQFLFYFDQLHLTSHGFAILGEYIVNRLEAPLTFAPQGDLAITSAMGFASTLYGKLDMFRETYGFVPPAMNAYAAYTKAPYLKAPPLQPVNPWSFYMQANGGISDRQSTVASNGFNLDSVGGTIGTEYRINNNAFVGGAFDYSNPKARLFNNAGTTDESIVEQARLGVGVIERTADESIVVDAILGSDGAADAIEIKAVRCHRALPVTDAAIGLHVERPGIDGLLRWRFQIRRPGVRRVGVHRRRHETVGLAEHVEFAVQRRGEAHRRCDGEIALWRKGERRIEAVDDVLAENCKTVRRQVQLVEVEQELVLQRRIPDTGERTCARAG